MPLSLLLNLPLELRLQIYSYLFTTPRGRIELSNKSYRMFIEDEQIQLSFLRTCKQIYTDAKHLVWKCNTLHLGSILHAYAPAPEGIIALVVANRIKHRVQSVSLDIDLLFEKTIANRLVFGHNLSILANWVKEGKLSSITLLPSSIIGGTYLSHRQLDKVLSHRRHHEKRIPYYKYLEELQFGTRESSSLSTIKRRLVIDTGIPKFNPGTWRPRNTIRPVAGNPMDMLQELGIAWGGRLEVNGVLVYQDGNLVDDIFLEQSDPHVYYYKDDTHLWLMTEIVKEPVDGKHIGNVLLDMDRLDRTAYYRNFEAQLDSLKETYGIRRIENLSSVAESKARTADARNALQNWIQSPGEDPEPWEGLDHA